MLCSCYAVHYLCITKTHIMEPLRRPTTQIVLDTRNKRSDETLPLKLRVTYERKPRVYGIKLELDDKTIIDSLTTEDFEKVKTQGKKEAEKFTQIREKLSIIQNEARGIIKKLDPFTFDSFRDQFTGVKKASDAGNVFIKYTETIKELEQNNQLGTASSYDLSLKSLKAFIKDATGKDPEKLHFKDITVNWLRKYETYMISDKPDLKPDGTVKTDSKGKELTKPGLTKTTVGIYLRPLRALFNTAIKAKEIESEVYPFGKEKDKKYAIPKGQKVKKALTKEQLKLLLNAVAPTPEQDKARDFWFFSYTCNGMNIKDICFLRNENLEPDSLSFFREKTKRTTDDQHPVIVILTEYAKTIIEKYRNQDTSPKAFVFPILNQTDSEQIKRKKVQGFTSFINQQIKKLAGSVGVTTDISTYFARHSWATLAIQGGASIEYVSAGLSHSDIKTTKGYFAGFADTTKKDIQEGLMNFNK